MERKGFVSPRELAAGKWIIAILFFYAFLPWARWWNDWQVQGERVARTRVSAIRANTEAGRVMGKVLQDKEYSPAECVKHQRYFNTLERRAPGRLADIRGKHPNEIITDYCRQQYYAENWSWAEKTAPIYFRQPDPQTGLRFWLEDQFRKELAAARIPYEKQDCLNPSWAGLWSCLSFIGGLCLLFSLFGAPFICLLRTAAVCQCWSEVIDLMWQKKKEVFWACLVWALGTEFFQPERAIEARIYEQSRKRQNQIPAKGHVDSTQVVDAIPLGVSQQLVMFWRLLRPVRQEGQSWWSLFQECRYSAYLTGLAMIYVILGSIQVARADSTVTGLNLVIQDNLARSGPYNEHLYILFKSGTTLALHANAGQLTTVEVTQDILRLKLPNGGMTAGPYVEVDRDGTLINKGLYSFFNLDWGKWKLTTPAYLYKDLRDRWQVLIPNIRLTRPLGQRRMGIGAAIFAREAESPSVLAGLSVGQPIGKKVMLWLRLGPRLVGPDQWQWHGRADIFTATF